MNIVQVGEDTVSEVNIQLTVERPNNSTSVLSSVIEQA